MQLLKNNIRDFLTLKELPREYSKTIINAKSVLLSFNINYHDIGSGRCDNVNKDSGGRYALLLVMKE